MKTIPGFLQHESVKVLDSWHGLLFLVRRTDPRRFADYCVVEVFGSLSRRWHHCDTRAEANRQYQELKEKLSSLLLLWLPELQKGRAYVQPIDETTRSPKPYYWSATVVSTHVH